MAFERDSFLMNCVLTCISDDYESIDIIVRHARRCGLRKGLKINRREVAEALEALIADGLADAYILTARPAGARKVRYSSDQLDELWFYITFSGKKEVKSIDELMSEG